MKIAMIGQKGIPAVYGGVEKHVHDLALRLAQNHDITVYSRKWYTQSDKTEFEGVNIVYTPTIHTKHLDAITHTFTSTIHAIFRNYDVIHYHGVGPALLSWIPRIFAPKTKIVTTFHSIDRYQQKWNIFAKLVLRLGEKAACIFAHETIAVSESIQQYCRNEFKKETSYIPNGVNEIKHSIKSDRLKKYKLKKGNYLVMVSRLIPDKGVHFLINAFQEIKKENQKNSKIQNLKLAIVGGAIDNEKYFNSLKNQAKKSKDIVFTDFQSGENLEQLYANALALVHPSLVEGMPITVLQAMSYSLPTLVSSIPEHLKLVKNPKMMFEENNVDALKKCLVDFLKLDKEKMKKIGKENKVYIKEHFSWDIIIPQVENLYKELLLAPNEKSLKKVVV